MRASIWVGVWVACGAAGCAAENGQSSAVLVQSVRSPTSASETVGLSMSPTSANDLLYISIVYAGAPSPAPRLSTAAGSAHPLDWTTMPGCAATTYDWVVESADPDATTVTVDLANNVASQLFVLEFAGVSREVEAASSMSDAGATSTAVAAQVDGAAGQVVISTVSTCGAVTSIAPESPFVTFGNTPLGDVAYDLPGVTGTYGAAWTLDNHGGWQARTVSLQ